MSHLTPDELIDAVEGTLAPARRAHLGSCAACQRETAGLEAILHDTRSVPVPEPSPLFWTLFSARVRAAVAAESEPAREWPQWFQWPAIVPLTGLALVILALVAVVARNPALDRAGWSRPVSVAAVPDPEAAADTAWAVVSDLLGDIDFDTAQEAGIASSPGSAERAALDLTAAEQQELLRLLEEELKGLGS